MEKLNKDLKEMIFHLSALTSEIDMLGENTNKLWIRNELKLLSGMMADIFTESLDNYGEWKLYFNSNGGKDFDNIEPSLITVKNTDPVAIYSAIITEVDENSIRLFYDFRSHSIFTDDGMFEWEGEYLKLEPNF